MEAIVEAIRSRRYAYTSEAELQEGIERVLIEEGIAYEREVALSPGDRIDFLVGEGIGVEVKIDGSISALTRQIHRYAQHDRISSLVVVTSRSRLANLPSSMNEKTVRVVHLIESCL